MSSISRLGIRALWGLAAAALAIAAMATAHASPTYPGVGFKIVHFFTGTDGSNPSGLSIAPNGKIVGVTTDGGTTPGSGVVFQIHGGGQVTVLHNFAGGAGGGDPYGGPTAGGDGSRLYGVTALGGTGQGTVYRLQHDGSFRILHAFAADGSEGSLPQAPLVLAGDGYFYGTASRGGTHGKGVVFRVSKNGHLTVVHSFAGTDGAEPYSGLLVASDGNLYGVTLHGGQADKGVAYRLTLQGQLTVLHSFVGGANDAEQPTGELIQATDGHFYGISNLGGAQDWAGVLYRMTSDGDVTVMHSFGGDGDAWGPSGGLLQASDGRLYGGTFGNISCAVYRFSLDGTYELLHTIRYKDGTHVVAPLVQRASGEIYGVLQDGGLSGRGSIFRLTLH